MTIVELPSKVGRVSWIRLFSEDGEVANIWGAAEVEFNTSIGAWFITIHNRNAIVGFYHADAIRRRE